MSAYQKNKTMKKRDSRKSKLLMTTEAAEYIGIHPKTLYSWAKQGKIKQHSYGWFAKVELDRFIDQGVAK